MSKGLKKFLITIAILVVFVGVCVLLSLRGIENFSDKYAGVDLEQSIEDMERAGTYKGYLLDHADAKDATKEVAVDLFKYTAEGDVNVVSDFEGVEKALYTETGSFVTWTVDIPESGFYSIYADYFIPKSRGVAAERGVYINGELPFTNALNSSFSRIWMDGGDVRVDNQGNQIRPTQVEKYDWQSSWFRDDMGYVTEPYKFYFEKGKNEFALSAENEPMVFSCIKLMPYKAPEYYADYKALNASNTSSEVADNFKCIIQGEDSTLRSESSLYAKYDRSSPTTQPNSVTNTVLNYVGGETWRTTGQWIEWNFDVPADGFYNITIKGRQNYSRGTVSSRKVLIDGQVPFKEIEEVAFEYDNDWNCLTLSDNEGVPFDFYLTAGTHTIRLEATLGGLGQILEDVEDSTFRLNQIYRKILVYTGATPDKYRDYNVDKVYPQVFSAMGLESLRLYKIVDDMVAFSGQKSDSIATAQTLAQQIERFMKKPQKITLEFTTFKDNITAMGTAQLTLNETKLDVDYIEVTGSSAKIDKDKANVFTKAWHEIKSFIASFFVDYNSVGDVYDDDTKVIKVWVLTGRDQGTILKSMIDDDFTPNSGIPVNVEIVAPDALLNAVLAGRGPDVVLSVGANLPVDYALRGASVDLTQFDGWQDVFSHYSKSSYEQYSLDGAIYGVPEQQTFSVMFYRKDVLDELELDIPNTWKELIEMLPTIQGNNLSVGIPTAAGSSASGAASTAIMSNTPELNLYFSLLYQYGGDMYNAAGTHTTVDTEAGVKAFDDYVRYFNDYGLPTVYDAVSRFRSGEMPLIISAYSTYNTLMVSAPEIKGLWDFTLIPGTEYVDESGNKYIDRSDFITGNATMMIENHDDQIKLMAWEFMKWWASADVQIRFGREIEALLGSSARYATANRDAFTNLSWSAKDIEVLNSQWDQTVGIREVPGGYFTGRHITNAIRKVINEKVDSRETIIDYSILIDEEIIKKRKEFNLPLE